MKETLEEIKSRIPYEKSKIWTNPKHFFYKFVCFFSLYKFVCYTMKTFNAEKRIRRGEE